jgi:hypothetical protein
MRVMEAERHDHDQNGGHDDAESLFHVLLPLPRVAPAHASVIWLRPGRADSPESALAVSSLGPGSAGSRRGSLPLMGERHYPDEP